MGIHSWAGLGIALGVVAGCATTQPAAVTRVVATNPAAFAGRPVCFAPPPPAASLVAQNNAMEALRLCETAARQERVSVVPAGTPGCAVATVAWSSHNTGEFESACGPTAGLASGMNWGCAGRDVRNKLAKVTISEPTGAPIAETLAALRSTNPAFTEKTFFALCRVAFHGYPQPLKNYQYEEEISEIE